MSNYIRQKYNNAAAETDKDPRISPFSLGRMIHDGRVDAAFQCIDKVEAGSFLPGLIAISQEITKPTGIDLSLRERFSWLSFWYDNNLIKPLFSGDMTDGDRWFETVLVTDRARDDSFIIKAAIVSENAEAATSYLLDVGGIDLNTKNDRPLTLAVIFGKSSLIPMLVESGADLYAASGEAFRLARKMPGYDVYTELQSAMRSIQRACQKELMLHAPEGITLQALRGGDEQTGLHLAAKAGMAGFLLSQDLLSGLNAEDFLKPSKTGATVSSILALRGEYDVLFDERIWRRDFIGAEQVYKSLERQDQIYAASAYRKLMQGCDVDRDIADLRKKWPRFTLKPRADKP